ncbi:hypothetical protein C5468_17530 [Photorhabdus luminescens subsp. mexicana]|uniref:Uncharacterized protein n=1 Tax=Photorhabdus luminescens subsp. mexicana TaxID=2100167 RepID=A0A4R4J407_PHOLU|nr:hypothetical protein C5468_17530 [Photorhabdus luminescens subsp. mexicana]
MQITKNTPGSKTNQNRSRGALGRGAGPGKRFNLTGIIINSQSHLAEKRATHNGPIKGNRGFFITILRITFNNPSLTILFN